MLRAIIEQEQEKIEENNIRQWIYSKRKPVIRGIRSITKKDRLKEKRQGDFCLKQDKKFYWKLFLETFQLSAFTFGGGYVIISLMKKKFVDKLHWIDEREILDFTAIAQSSPGAIAVNAAVLLGYRLSGIPGALVAILGTVLPPFLLLSVISVGYSAFIGNKVVKNVLQGMQAGVCAVIIDVVITMGRAILKEHHGIVPAILMAGSFIAAALFHVNPVYVIFFCGLVGCLSVKKETGKGDSSHDLS